jgi:hypothetical protein
VLYCKDSHITPENRKSTVYFFISTPSLPGVHPEFFVGGGGGGLMLRLYIFNLCFILKIMF